MTTTPEPPAGARGAVDLTGMAAPTSTTSGAGALGATAPASASASADGGAPGVPDGLLIEASDATFAQLLTKYVGVAGLLVLWTSQHTQTRIYRDQVAGVAAKFGGRVVVVSADLATNQGLAQSLIPLIQQAFGQASVPAIFGLLQGQPVPLMPGMAPEPQIAEAIEQLLEAAVRSGITGRVELTGGAEEEEELSPLHQKAFDAIEAGDLDAAAAAYREALEANPKDSDAELGLAQVALMKRTQDVDLQSARDAAGADPADIDAALVVADLDVLGGHVEDAFMRLIELVRETSGEDRDRVRTRLLELFNVVGSHDDRVRKGRTALMNALF